MLTKTRRRSGGPVTIQVKKKKVIQSGFQTFDQKSVFSNMEDSSANLLAVVEQGGEAPTVKVLSHATQKTRDIWPIVVRNRLKEEGKEKVVLERMSNFSQRVRSLPDVDPTSQLMPGEIIELQNTMVDIGETTLFPWNFKRIGKRAVMPETLMMPECLATLISSKNSETGARDYRIGIAARGEAQSIGALFDSIEIMRSFLGNKEPMINGFILRGTAKSGAKEKQGLTCFRTREDDLENLSDDEVILNFINNKAQQVINKTSDDNPWEVIPLYVIRPSSVLRQKLESIAKRLPKLDTPESNPYEAAFAHCNIVLSFDSDPEKPNAISFNTSRAKPLILEAGIPERATETKIKVFKEANQAKTEALPG